MESARRNRPLIVAPAGADDLLPTQIECEPPTQIDIVAPARLAIGGITADGVFYPLKMGRNVIGRKASSSKADIQIPCADNIISREHIVIDVEQAPGQAAASHTLSLFKEVKNRTMFRGAAMKFGESHALGDGDIIHLPGKEVVFSIPDEDKTII